MINIIKHVWRVGCEASTHVKNLLTNRGKSEMFIYKIRAFEDCEILFILNNISSRDGTIFIIVITVRTSSFVSDISVQKNVAV